MIEHVDCMLVDDVDYVDGRLEGIDDRDCVQVEDVDCSSILDVNLQRWHDEVEDREVEVQGRRDVVETDVVVEC